MRIEGIRGDLDRQWLRRQVDNDGLMVDNIAVQDQIVSTARMVARQPLVERLVSTTAEVRVGNGSSHSFRGPHEHHVDWTTVRQPPFRSDAVVGHSQFERQYHHRNDVLAL